MEGGTRRGSAAELWGYCLAPLGALLIFVHGGCAAPNAPGESAQFRHNMDGKWRARAADKAADVRDKATRDSQVDEFASDASNRANKSRDSKTSVSSPADAGEKHASNKLAVYAQEVEAGSNTNPKTSDQAVRNAGQAVAAAGEEFSGPFLITGDPENGVESQSAMPATFRVVQPETDEDGSSVAEPSTELPVADNATDESYPINLGTALQLAGANNLQLALATEQVREAYARVDQAEVLWIPSLNMGVGYNSHAGQIQATEGDIVEVNRESLFVGGGPVLSGAPLTGASGGPARFFVDISPADIYFEPLAARQSAAGAQRNSAAVFNDTLLEVTNTYLALLSAQSEVAIAQEAVRYAEELVRITGEFARSGAGLPADTERARTELAERKRQELAAEQRRRVISAELARLLRLPPDVILFATDAQPSPLPLIAEGRPLGELIAQGVAGRPELGRQQAAIGETYQRLRQEQVRPWLPNLHLGASSGAFGGGADSFFGDFSDRTDFDALAVWEMRNFGLGNRALVRERASQHRQAHFRFDQARDRIAAEITQAYHQVEYRRQQIEQSEMQVKAAARALPLNFEGIRGRELRPIEAQQAIAALAGARNRYLEAVVGYNQAQFALLRAIGRPAEGAIDATRELEEAPAPLQIPEPAPPAL